MKITKAIRPALAAIVLTAAFASAMPARAQGPTGSYGSGITCTNLDAALPATLVLTFYQQDSDVAALSYPDQAQVPPGASRLYFTPNSPAGLPSPFLGSAVVSSDRALACNVNTQVVGNGIGTAGSPARAGTSAGLDSSQAAATLYAAQVIKGLGGYNSYMAIQNTDSVAVNVTVSYASRAGVAIPAATETLSIKPQATHVFYQASNTNLPAGFLGGATISSTGGKLVGAVAFYNDGSSAQKAQFNAYNTQAVGASKLLVPRFVRNFYGYQGGMNIQNIGTSAVTIKATFTFAGKQYIVNPAPIAPGATWSPFATNISELAEVDTLPMSQRTGSAVIESVTAGGSIIGVVNEGNDGACTICGVIPTEWIGQGGTYNAFLDGSATNTIFFAQVPRKAGGYFSGGTQVLNTTGADGSCTYTYAGVLAATVTKAIPANSSLSIFTPNVDNLTDGFNSAVKVVCTMPVVGISNFSARSTTFIGDSFTVANGLNQ